MALTAIFCIRKILCRPTSFEIIDGAQMNLKSQNEATAHGQRSATWFTSRAYTTIRETKIRSISLCVVQQGK